MKHSSLYSHEHQVLVLFLRDLRLEAGLSQVDAAAAIGRPQAHVSAIEVGRRGLDLLQVREFAELYGVNFVRFATLFEERLRAIPYRPPRRTRKDAAQKPAPKAKAGPAKKVRGKR